MLRLSAAAVVVLVAGAAQAQPAVQTCPADQAICVVQNGQTLNRVIEGDTTATGARVNADRIYQLQRDAIYLMDDDVRNDGYHLRIYGEESDAGAMPQVYTTRNPDSGNVVGDPFGMQGDITFRNWAMNGFLPEAGGGDGIAAQSTRVVRVRAPGFNLVMDRFYAVNFVASVVRAASALRSFELTNSVWANIGWLGDNGTNLGAGKGIDLRDGSIESLVMRNNTFVNFTDRIIRHRNSTAPLQNLLFDHNTLVNIVSYHGTLALGLVGESVQITNNLFYDSFVAGADSSDIVRQEEFNESGELYPNNKAKMHWIFTEPSALATTEFTVGNNAYVVTNAVEQFYQTYGDGNGDKDIIDEGPALTDYIRARISDPDMAFVEYDFALANVPNAPVNLVTWYREETGRTKETITFDPATDDFDRRDLAYFLPGGGFDASYPTTAAAYTAAAGSCPTGDLTWFAGIDVTACLEAATTSEGGPAAAAFALSNAPNPFRSGTTVRYTLEEPSDVTLSVYDALGREVAMLDSGLQTAGEHTADWSAAGVAPGVYIVRLQAGGATASHRVSVVR